ncbi:dioxygenase [Streptomyces lasalocidi]
MVRTQTTTSAAGTAATKAFRERTADGRPGVSAERVSAFAGDVLDRVRQALRDHNMTYSEYQAAKQWLIDLGEAGEWPLFLDVFVEYVVEDMHNARREGSKGSILGPYYLPGQKTLPATATLPMRPDEKGTPLVFEGQVRDLTGSPVPGAVLDVWQADDDGFYSGFAPGIPEGNLRGVVIADDEGRFAITTVRPAPYQIPVDGPTGALINAADWHAWRPAHLHLIINASGFRTITTQLYFAATASG